MTASPVAALISAIPGYPAFVESKIVLISFNGRCEAVHKNDRASKENCGDGKKYVIEHGSRGMIEWFRNGSLALFL
jgi:hypothetical protein